MKLRDEIISDREFARRRGNDERFHAIKVGEDRWKVLGAPSLRHPIDQTFPDKEG